jgi:hypothetical protein
MTATPGDLDRLCVFDESNRTVDPLALNSGFEVELTGNSSFLPVADIVANGNSTPRIVVSPLAVEIENFGTFTNQSVCTSR